MVYVAVFALTMMQLGLALHHDQHSIADLTGTCAACVQLEQLDDAINGTHLEIDAPLSTTSFAAFSVQSAAKQSLRAYFGRAPPASA